MAIGDKQVLNSQVADGSSDYLIPGAVSLQLKAVQALFEDNGAGSDWLPAVVAISDSGHVFWRALDQGVKVTAGADAEVSWFPGVKHASTASTGGTSMPLLALVASGGAPTFQSLTSGVQTAVQFDPIGGLSAETSALPWTLTGVTPGTIDTVTFAEQGLYLCSGQFSLGGAAGNFAKNLVLNVFSTTTIGYGLGMTQSEFDTIEAQLNTHAIVGVTAADAAGGFVQVSMLATQTSGGARLRDYASIVIARLSPVFP